MHILFETDPNINLKIFINALKSASSRKMQIDFKNYLKHFYWKPYFWSNSYFICTVGETNSTLVKNYIKNQRK